MKSLALVLVALVAISAASQLVEEAKRELEYKRNDTENRVRYSLRNALGNALILPLRQLNNLEPTGIRDFYDIGAYGDSDVVKAQVYESLNFWREKMEEAVAPFINHPEEWTYLIIDEIFVPQDPTWNNTEEYKEASRLIEYMVIYELSVVFGDYRGYENQISPKKLDEVTLSNFYRMLINGIYEEVEKSITISGQYAKINVANGADLDNELLVLFDEAKRNREYFNEKATALVDEYKKNVPN